MDQYKNEEERKRASNERREDARKKRIASYVYVVKNADGDTLSVWMCPDEAMQARRAPSHHVQVMEGT